MLTDTEQTTTEILNATTALIAEFTKTIEAITAAGEDATIKRLADGMGDVLKAVAKQLER